jgi:hypothetical protein
VTSLIRATEHENVIMRCIVQASPMGKAYWKFEGKKININTSHIYEVNNIYLLTKEEEIECLMATFLSKRSLNKLFISNMLHYYFQKFLYFSL